MDSVSFQGLKQKIATIDIGTNTLLMLAAETEGKEIRNVLQDFHRIARLGENVNETGMICEAARTRARNILEEYAAYLGENDIILADTVGTSALRDAANGAEVIEEFEEILGGKVRVISGEEEAGLTFIGSLVNDLPSAVIDIGGGSTEVVFGDREKITFKKSFQIGAVRLTEMFIKNDPPRKEETDLLTKYVIDTFDFEKRREYTRIIAVAGTPTTLARIHLGLREFDYEKIHGHFIPAEELSRIVAEVSRKSRKGLIEDYGTHPDRADIIAGGSLILDTFCKVTGAPGVTVSCHGLRYGAMYNYLRTMRESS